MYIFLLLSLLDQIKVLFYKLGKENPLFQKYTPLKMLKLSTLKKTLFINTELFWTRK